jgi:hypothetical protein
MADLKISQLTAVTTPVTGAELLPAVQSSTTKKVTIAQLKPGLSLGTMADQNASAVAITGGTITGITDLAVADGGTGASTLTGYVKGSGTSALTASSTIPNTDVSGLGTMSTQNATAVAITGGTITGETAVYNSRGQVTATGGSTTTLFTLANVSSNQSYQLSVRQSGAGGNTVIAQVLAYGASAGALRIAQDNTNIVLDMNITTSGLAVRLVLGAGFGSTTWDWVLTQFG